MQAVAQAQMNAESTRIGAVEQIRSLEMQLEAARHENEMIKQQMNQVMEDSKRAGDHGAVNGAGFNLIFQRLAGIECNFKDWKRKWILIRNTSKNYGCINHQFLKFNKRVGKHQLFVWTVKIHRAEMSSNRLRMTGKIVGLKMGLK